jgi:hypothetical protein
MWQNFNVTVNVGVTEEAGEVKFVTKNTMDDSRRKQNLDLNSSSVKGE